MDTKKLLIATLLGTLAMFFSGWLIWGVFIEPMKHSHVFECEGLYPEAPRVGLIAVAQVLTAFLWAYIYNRWAGISTFMTGAKAGVFLAVLFGLSYGIMTMAGTNLWNWTAVAMDLGGNIVWGGLSGGVIGWALGMGKD